MWELMEPWWRWKTGSGSDAYESDISWEVSTLPVALKHERKMHSLLAKARIPHRLHLIDTASLDHKPISVLGRWTGRRKRS